MIKCSYCQSLDIKKNGFNYDTNHKVQKYKCLSCKKIFSYPDRLPRNHVSSEIVSLCIDLYLKGLSYRIIRQQLIEQFGIRVSHVTIYYWLQQYSELIKNYVKTLNPNLSAVWQLDETVIDFKGKSNWCWDCVDTVSRYAIDMYLSGSNGTDSGLEFFGRIKESTRSEPEVFSTDGNRAYIAPLNKYYPNAKRMRIKHITLKPNTSFIERFHGTIKNRTKVMRGFDGFNPCQNWLTLFQIYYNFLRPHMALDGKTPAQRAGIDIEFPDRWVSLIRSSLLVVNNFS